MKNLFLIKKMKTILDKINENINTGLSNKDKLIKPAILKHENKPCIIFGNKINNTKEGNKSFNTAIWIGFEPESKFNDYVKKYGNDNKTYYLIAYIKDDGSNYCTFIDSDKVKL